MENFFRYLTSGPEDKLWGIYLTVGGRYTSVVDSVYPKKDHPSGYYFDWHTGRILNEYQLNFISEGHGTLETESGQYEVEAGTLMIIEPGAWHRYRPDPSTGWTEYYIGFDGQLAKHFISSTFPSIKQRPVYTSSNQLEILDTYQKILDLVHHQKPGYHQVASGLILKLLGYINGQLKSQSFDDTRVESLVNDAKNHIWEHVHENADLKEFAKSHSVSYSYFRKMFKLYTGIAPHQFYLDLKIMRAKELLVSSNRTIKEITYDLGFDSIHYFSRLFKKKTGVSPSQFKLGGNPNKG
ncbi:MAG: AraC family transcriptional regulator [Cyclobacteriaceae bacterium]